MKNKSSHTRVMDRADTGGTLHACTALYGVQPEASVTLLNLASLPGYLAGQLVGLPAKGYLYCTYVNAIQLWRDKYTRSTA